MALQPRQKEEEHGYTLTLHPRYHVDRSCRCPLLKRYRGPTLADLQQSARKGCPYCVLRSAAVEQIWPEVQKSAYIKPGGNRYNYSPTYDHGNFHTIAYRHFPSRSSSARTEGAIDIVWDLDFERCFKSCKFKFYRKGLFLNKYKALRTIPCDTSSTISLQTAIHWIKICDEGHGCMPKRVPQVPRRLLDVRNDGVQLRETTIEYHGAEYTCLSHCWGSDTASMLRTTLSNLGLHKEDIPWAQLPRTFQDAISFTRRLGVGFLWIDSLCIIQDDPGDWQQQSANMATIFQNAYITLAATTSNNADGGCYTRMEKPRKHLTGSTLALFKYPDGTEWPVSARRALEHRQGLFPLLQRGWVYQERLLSPRILHFADEELIWECKESVHCECGSKQTSIEFKRVSITEDVVTNQDHSRHEAVQDWYRVVADYTSSSLSYPKDAFPALSGIAKVFMTRLQDEYVAGMWRTSLASQLLWFFRSTATLITTRMKLWRAPTWSWASANWSSPFMMMPKCYELAEVKQVTCTPYGEDPTGELKTAHLTLRTKIVSGYMLKCIKGADTECTKYVLHLDGGFRIAQLSEAFTSFQQAETGFLALSDDRLAGGEGLLDVAVAQVASWTGKRWVQVDGDSHSSRRISDEVRSYLLLAKDESNKSHWIRIGLVVVTRYHPNLGPWKSPWVGDVKVEDVVKMLDDKYTVEHRRLFTAFDIQEAQDITIW